MVPIMPRAANTLNSKPLLPLVEIIPIAHSLARKEAHRDDDIEDLVQVGLFAYHRLEQRGSPVTRPAAVARTVIQRAMRGYYYHLGEWQGRGETDRFVPLDEPLGIAAVVGPVQLELLEWADYFEALERRAGKTARLIVENLLGPSGPCAEHILGEVQKKQQAQARVAGRSAAVRRHQPRGVKKGIRVTGRMVREGLGLSAAEWTAAMQSIRAFTAEWCGHGLSGFAGTTE